MEQVIKPLGSTVPKLSFKPRLPCFVKWLTFINTVTNNILCKEEMPIQVFIIISYEKIDFILTGFLSAFCPRGGKYVSACKALVKLGGSRGMLCLEILILDLLSDTIWWNLGLFLHKHNLHELKCSKQCSLI